MHQPVLTWHSGHGTIAAGRSWLTIEVDNSRILRIRGDNLMQEMQRALNKWHRAESESSQCQIPALGLNIHHDGKWCTSLSGPSSKHGNITFSPHRDVLKDLLSWLTHCSGKKGPAIDDFALFKVRKSESGIVLRTPHCAVRLSPDEAGSLAAVIAEEAQEAQPGHGSMTHTMDDETWVEINITGEAEFHLKIGRERSHFMQARLCRTSLVRLAEMISDANTRT